MMYLDPLNRKFNFYKNPLLIWIGLTLYGTGWGGLYTLIQLLVADLFGLIAIGKIWE
ncbi:MAG: hypothetical protein Ct9H90mP13_10100 [Pseudomonadota bacterium]|nr:MAG: hypothetical protein Ct9H90mP13_10100 [Pseudomonadota bacterium]